jgi:hypothetical protein
MKEHTDRGRWPYSNKLTAGLRHKIRRIVVMFTEVLCEIFDESAYSRFLRREQTGCSRESYAEFLRENELTKARRPRCC